MPAVLSGKWLVVSGVSAAVIAGAAWFGFAAVPPKETIKQSPKTTQGCNASMIMLMLPADVSRGTIEILSPVMDTDGFEQRAYPVTRPLCLPIKDLEFLAKRAALAPGELLELKIAHDPEGSRKAFRSRLEYEPELDGEASDLPYPPPDMKFGEMSWWPDRGRAPITVQWHADFRGHLAQLMAPYAAAEAQKVAAGEKPTGAAWSETFDDTTLTFVPTKKFRKMIAYSISPEVSDRTCTAPYDLVEQVKSVKYAYGFVIEGFETWSKDEGKQDYSSDETLLPRAYQGNLRDIVAEGRIVRITKQRCGMGQVQSLVAVRPV